MGVEFNNSRNQNYNAGPTAPQHTIGTHLLL